MACQALSCLASAVSVDSSGKPTGNENCPENYPNIPELSTRGIRLQRDGLDERQDLILRIMNCCHLRPSCPTKGRDLTTRCEAIP